MTEDAFLVNFYDCIWKYDMSTNFAVSSVERQKLLFKYIQEQKRVSVNEICENFSVSLATARRDLDALAESGLVSRVRGGAILAESPASELPVLIRSKEQSEEKVRIGKVAAELVKEGETVFIGSGTTALEVAHNLQKRENITVITNSLLVLNALAQAPGVNIIGLGGMFRRSELSLIGHITENALSELRADAVILGIRSIDPIQGLSSQYLPETMTDRALLNIGRRVILVADHTKCGRVSPAYVAPVTAIDILVTDNLAPPEFVSALEERGVQVLIA